MTPLQKAAQALIYRWDTADWKSTKHTADFVNALRKALEAEQAQAVEPAIYQRRMRPTWMDEGTGWSSWETCLKESFLWSHKNPKIHDWEYEARALFTHPVPPTGEQIDWQGMYLKAKSEKDIGPLARMEPVSEAQQVAVPDKREPLSDEEAKNLLENSDLLDMFEHIGWYSAPRQGFNKHALSLIRAIEAHHKIGAKP